MDPRDDLKIAIVHDYLNQYGGAERVLEILHEIYPQAPVYTIVHDPSKVPASYQKWDIRSSFINKLPGVKGHYEKYFLLYPRAVESFDLGRYDLVISSSSAWAKGAKTGSHVWHLCYLHNTMRFVWDWHQQTIKEFPHYLRFLLKPLLSLVRRWDVISSKRPDLIIANSREVQKRISRYYNRDSIVLHPAVDIEYFRPSGNGPSDYYLAMARLKPYKRMDIAVEAFNQNGRPLTIAGDGPEYGRLRRMAGSNITFTGKISDQELLGLYQNCRALIFTPLEDFGIAPLEAQACGRPVIAFGQGGALETVVDKRTGMFFYRQEPESLLEAVREFERTEFSSAVIRDHAAQFDKKLFIAKFRSLVEQEYMKYRAGHQ